MKLPYKWTKREKRNSFVSRPFDDDMFYIWLFIIIFLSYCHTPSGLSLLLLSSFYQFVFPHLLWSSKVPAVSPRCFFRGLFFWESLILFLHCTAQSCFYVSTLYCKVLFLRCTAKSCFYVVLQSLVSTLFLQSLVSTLYCKVLFLRCTAKSCQVAKLLLGPAVGERETIVHLNRMGLIPQRPSLFNLGSKR